MQKKLESIQIARAVAALLVVLFHSHYLIDSFPPGFRLSIPFVYTKGYWGVDIFFVVSGFIIADVTSKPGFTLAPYFIKRFFRIYPIYWIFCYAALVSYYEFGLNIGQKLDYETIYASFLAAPINVNDSFPIYPVGWTLTYEVFFYLLTGLVLSIAGHRTLIVILLVFGLSGLAAIGLGALNLGYFEAWRLLVFSPYQIFFAAGILIFRFQDKLIKLGVIPVLSASALAFYLALDKVPSEVAAYIWVCLGSSLFIVGFLNAEKKGLLNPKNALLKLIIRTMIGIGNASFSLYLMHWIVFRWMGYDKTLAYVSLPEWSAEIWRYFGVLVVIAASFALHYCIEKPVIKIGNWVCRLIDQVSRRRQTSGRESTQQARAHGNPGT